ncbi:hypothetical protein [Streptomyces sp. NPDC018833]
MTDMSVALQAAILIAILAGIALLLVVLARTERPPRPRHPGRRRQP